MHRNKFFSFTDYDPKLKPGIRSAQQLQQTSKRSEYKQYQKAFPIPQPLPFFRGPKFCVLRSVGKSTLAHGKSLCGKQGCLSQTNRGGQSIPTPTLWWTDKTISCVCVCVCVCVYIHTHTHTHRVITWYITRIPPLDVLRLIPLSCKAYLFQEVFFLSENLVRSITRRTELATTI